jgi:hypothetical protein
MYTRMVPDALSKGFLTPPKASIAIGVPYPFY